jgi:hypothetical protein
MTGPGLILVTALIVSGSERPVDFDTEVIPILTRSGCNAGACHGAAIGRGGFKLSLLGGDPARDYEAVVHELEGRRVNPSRPAESLILAKATGRIDHEGGVRFSGNGEAAERLLTWVRAGAPRLEARRLRDLVVEPVRKVVEPAGSEVAIRVRARFEDGSVEDVTRWTVLTPAEPSAVELRRSNESSVAVVHRAGRNVVIARYLDRVIPVQLIVPMAERPVNLTGEPRHNLIDEAVLAALGTLRIPPSPMSDDATFLRRARIDLTGRLPGADEVRAFLADRDPSKRERMVDRLLASDTFDEYWTFRLASLLRVRPQGNDVEAAATFHRWVREQVSSRSSFGAMARSLLTATGDTHRYGPANFHRVVGDPRSQAEYAAQVFLGVRLQCANCHNHPLDRWTQDDYHGLAAVFAHLERGREVKVVASGDVTHPRTGEPARPKIPGSRFLDREEDGLATLAEWLVQPGNPYFARATVNRLWKALMGRGLVEPVDDLRATNPATNPELLDALAADFVAHDFDLRRTLRLIATSATYARSSSPTPANRADDCYHSHALVRPLGPEVLADALADVTGIADRYGDLPDRTRAVALIDPAVPSESLDILGRCSRQISCDEPGASGGSLAAKLHLINGPLINRKITDPGGRLARAIASGLSDRRLIEEFYLSALGRFPDDRESAFWGEKLEAAADPPARRSLLEDFLWGLLNCREFRTNH